MVKASDMKPSGTQSAWNLLLKRTRSGEFALPLADDRVEVSGSLAPDPMDQGMCFATIAADFDVLLAELRALGVQIESAELTIRNEPRRSGWNATPEPLDFFDRFDYRIAFKPAT